MVENGTGHLPIPPVPGDNHEEDEGGFGHIDVPPVLGAYEELRLQISHILDLLMPEEGDALLPLSGAEGVDLVHLREVLVSWIQDHLDQDGLFIPGRRALLTAAPGAVEGFVEHLLDEYWWIEFLPVPEETPDSPEPATAGEPGLAVLRLDQGEDSMPFGYDISPRLTPQTDEVRAAQRARLGEETAPEDTATPPEDTALEDGTGLAPGA